VQGDTAKTPRPSALALATLLLASVALADTPKAPPRGAGIPIANISASDTHVELAGPQGKWQHVETGSRVKTGDRVRTGPQSTALIGFPWMHINVGPSSELSIAPSQVLSTTLSAGRVEEHARGGDIIKLRTPEAQIRGGGRVVVRREGHTTLVMVWDGRSRVEAAGKVVFLNRGMGAVIEGSGRPSTPLPLPASPSGLSPGVDPGYVVRGAPARLVWSPSGGLNHIQIQGVDSEDVLLERDVEGPPFSLDIPWLGTFRWHVSKRHENGLESIPSADGTICVVEK
jgi:hypothetical protein